MKYFMLIPVFVLFLGSCGNNERNKEVRNEYDSNYSSAEETVNKIDVYSGFDSSNYDEAYEAMIKKGKSRLSRLSKEDFAKMQYLKDEMDKVQKEMRTIEGYDHERLMRINVRIEQLQNEGKKIGRKLGLE